MHVSTKLLCCAGAAAIAACAYFNVATFESTPVHGHASLTVQDGDSPVDAAASPRFPDAHGAPAAVCPWSPCDIGALFAMGAR